jgi:hypothetical protein
MARPKKSATAAEQRVVKKGEVVLSEAQVEELRGVLSGISESRSMADDIGTNSCDDMKEIGYTIGRIFSKLDVIEDKLDDLLDAVAPVSYDFDDEDDDY